MTAYIFPVRKLEVAKRLKGILSDIYMLVLLSEHVRVMARGVRDL
jgi:hypothetical protein